MTKQSLVLLKSPEEPSRLRKLENHTPPPPTHTHTSHFYFHLWPRQETLYLVILEWGPRGSPPPVSKDHRVASSLVSHTGFGHQGRSDLGQVSCQGARCLQVRTMQMAPHTSQTDTSRVRGSLKLRTQGSQASDQSLLKGES